MNNIITGSAGKKIKIIFWSVTIPFSAFMLFSAIPDIMVVPDAVKFMNSLGYPNYIIPFLGIAKLLGIIAILIPGFPRIKEWAYAGLFYDLAGAVYSILRSGGFDPKISFMLLPILLLILSYIYYHKKLRIATSR